MSFVSQKQLTALSSFATFVELLQNPESLNTLVNDLKQATKSHEEAVAAVTKINEVDAYVAKSKQQIDEQLKMVELKYAELESKQANADKMNQEKFKALEDTAAALVEKEQTLNKREASLDELGKVLNNKAAELDSRVVSLNKEQAEVEAKAQALTEKEQALKKLFG